MKNRSVFSILILCCFLCINSISAQSFRPQNIGLWNQIKKNLPISIITKVPIQVGRNTAFIFLSPECPLSRNYIPELNRIKNAYKNCEIIGVFPGKSYSLKEIKTFVNDYKITFITVTDEKKSLTKLLKGSVTPQVVLVDKAGSLVYSGLVDDKIIELGQQRQVVSKHYLTDAIDELEQGRKIVINYTKPIGCYINDL